MTDHFIDLAGVKIRYRITLAKGASRGRIFVLPGFTEFIEKHDDQTQAFRAMGLDVLTIDWPGQGLSGRLTQHPHLIHSDGYDQHLDAVVAAGQAAGFLDGALPVMIFGHSMGGHLGLRLGHQLRHQHNIAPRAVMLSSPMIMPPVMPPKFIFSALSLVCKLGFSRKAVPFQQGFSRNSNFSPKNNLTRNPIGYQLQHDLIRINPDLRTQGPSFGWVRAAYASCLATTANQDWMQGYEAPVQAHLAGDETVVGASYSAPCLKEIKGAEIFEYPDAKHELMLELDDVQELIWGRLKAFVDRQLTA